MAINYSNSGVDYFLIPKKPFFIKHGWDVCLATFLFLTLGLTACAGQAAWPMSNKINVSLTIQDETGQPVPYVSIWSYDHRLISEESNKLNLQSVDLWRLTTRYNDCFEFVHPSNKPVVALRVPAMGDSEGKMAEILDYEKLRGKGQQRPETFYFGYSFMKHGYLPGKVDFTAASNQSDFKATITLKRDPATPLEAQSYLQTYERIRYELSLIALRNLEMTQENNQRLEAYYPKLEAAAQAALQAGDKAAAARIYARMQYLPQLQISNGKVIGFDQSKPDSPRSLAALAKAYELDPKQVYILTEANKWRIFKTPPLNAKGEQQSWDSFYEQYFADYRERLWPGKYTSRVYRYLASGLYVKAYQAIKDAEQFEPLAEDFQELLDKLKRTMKRENVPIPPEW